MKRKRHSWDAEGGGKAVNKSGTAEDMLINMLSSLAKIAGDESIFLISGAEKKEVRTK